MDRINELIELLLVLIPLGAAARIIYCLAVKSMDGDEGKSYNIRIRNAIVFTVCAETIAGLLRWAGSYFTPR
jgi:hypothetical protein